MPITNKIDVVIPCYEDEVNARFMHSLFPSRITLPNFQRIAYATEADARKNVRNVKSVKHFVTVSIPGDWIDLVKLQENGYAVVNYNKSSLRAAPTLVGKKLFA